MEKGQLWLYQNRPYIFEHYKRDYPQNVFLFTELGNTLFEFIMHII